MPERMEAQTWNTLDNNVASTLHAESVRGPLRVEADEETVVDVEIMEEGEEGESDGPVPAVV